MLVVEDGVEELEDELLLFTREELDLLELSLQLRSRARFAFDGVRLASQWLLAAVGRDLDFDVE